MLALERRDKMKAVGIPLCLVPAGCRVSLLEERNKMKPGQFTNEQIVAVLQEAEKGEKTGVDLCREKGISEASFYSWRKKFGGLQTRDVARLRELEKENARLKRLLAERDLENDIMKEALAKNW